MTGLRFGDPDSTHTLREVRLTGRGFVLAFRSKADAERFISFVEAHARECPQLDPTESYRLEADWELGPFTEPPAYAISELDDEVIFGMVSELMSARMGSELPSEDEMTDVNISSTPAGIAFEIHCLPPPRLN